MIARHSWGGIAPVQESVQINFFQAIAGGHFQHGKDMIFVAVHASRREQSHNVQCASALPGQFNRFAQRGVGIKAAILNIHIDPAQILIHHAPGADVEMPHFRVAHLMGRQANKFFGSFKQCVRIIVPKLVPVGLKGGKNSVVVGILAVTETIEYEQQNWGDFH